MKSRSGSSLFLVLCNVAYISAISAQSLERDIGTPPVYDWDGAIEWADDPDMTSILKVLKDFGIPSATVGYQLNPDPSKIHFNAPAVWRNPQVWWMAGFGLNYKSPMRIASVSKPLIAAAWQQPPLSSMLDEEFYTVWEEYCSDLPEPLDERARQITIRHLLDHRSGFTNGGIGFDPAFSGTPIDELVPQILESTTLSSNPGTQYSYLNLGYDTLSRLGQCISGTQDFVKVSFPGGVSGDAPVFPARDTVSERVRGCPGGVACTAEPSLYYVQSPDGEFDISPGGTTGNYLSNVATLSWFASHYWLGGSTFGQRMPVPAPGGLTWVFNGAFPGTSAVLVQYTTPSGLVSSVCVLVPTRPRPNENQFFEQLNSASMALLQNKFG